MKFAVIIAAALALQAPAAFAAVSRVNKTWVSSTGVDTGTCTLAAPCKTFQYAHDQTSPGGEIDVKDSGGYGTLTITKAISIITSQGVLATINVPAQATGITVNAGASDIVSLDGLTIDGHDVGALIGVNVTSAGLVTIEKSRVRNCATGVSTSSGPLYLVHSTLIGNKLGVNGQGTGTVYIGDDFIASTLPSRAYTGAATSYGNNYLVGNDLSTLGTRALR